MAFLNYAKKEISAKIVYYGPGLSGKTTNLEWIHKKILPERRGKLISLETRTDRTLFFDFLPVQLGEVQGFAMRFNVYTVPGQIFYNETRKMVLKGVDGIVFVADSQKEMAHENLESLKNLEENLKGHGRDIRDIPLVLQYNKRDLPKILSTQEMNRLLNPRGLPFFEAVAIRGDGVLATLTRITRMVAEKIQAPDKAGPSIFPPSSSLDIPTAALVEPDRSEKPKVFFSSPASGPSIVSGPIEAAPPAEHGHTREPSIVRAGLENLLLEPEADTPSPSIIGPVVGREGEPEIGMGEGVPLIGELGMADGPLPAPILEPQPHTGPEHPPRAAPRPAAGPASPAVEPQQIALDLEPSVRHIPEVRLPEAAEGGLEPVVSVGTPEKVGAARFHIPFFVSLPGSSKKVSFVLGIDLGLKKDENPP